MKKRSSSGNPSLPYDPARRRAATRTRNSMPSHKTSLSRVVVMSFHPVTKEFSERLEKLCGPVDAYFDAASLRKLSLTAGVRELRNIRADEVIVALESDVARVLVGPLSIAASFTRAKAIKVVWPDLRVETVSRLRAIRHVVAVIRDTLSSRRSLARMLRDGDAMRQAPMPRQVTSGSGTRILYLDANISLGTAVGGSVGHTAGVIDGFLDHGFELDYASLKQIPTDRRGATPLKLQPETLLAVPPELNFYRYAELIERQIIPRHRANPWSFIYQRFSLHNFTGPHLGRKLNIPVVLEFNGSEAWAAANWGTRLALHDEAVATESAALATADLIVTVSDELGHDLQRRGIPAERIVVYPNCVDPALFDPRRFRAEDLAALRGRYDISPDALIVGFIGTFGQWHGVEFLAQCIADMVRDDSAWIRRNKLHFMLVGDGLKMAAVRELVGSEEVSRYVTLTGLVAQSEAAKYLACADLLVSPHVPNTDGSGFFGSPTKLFEYMAMEKPIVAAALGQISDVIAGKGATALGSMPPGAGEMCGFLYEPGDPWAFKRTLRAVVDDMPAAAKVAKMARAEVLNRYTWKRHVEAILTAMSNNGLIGEAPQQMAVGSEKQGQF
ncbi:MAG: glycosyltransferase [bacterium]|nr:glycosyltransferase [bacterium]